MRAAAAAVRQRRCAARVDRAAQRGFALVMVLWVLAGLTVVAVAVASSLRVNSESVKLLRERVRNEADFLSTAARIQVMASTGEALRNTVESSRGRLFVDGRVQAVAPGEWVTVQDARGLLDLNQPGKLLPGLLRRCGAAENMLGSLQDSLADYVDEDDLKRLNGAEAFDYRLAEMAAPRNADLMSREELWRVEGWPALQTAWQAAGCDALVTVHGDGRFNPNTAPALLLEASGMSAENAAALIDARQAGLPTREIQSGGSGAFNPFSLLGGGFAGATMRVRHQAASVEWTLEYELQLTPSSEGGPWRMLELRYPPRAASTPEAATPLPPADYQVSEREGPTRNASPDLPAFK